MQTDIPHYKTRTAIAIVVANMIGTGVFTSLGFQLLEIQSGIALIMLWVVGGIAALCGALCYAELGAALPRNGGEYHFLTECYHPAAGFISGWISFTVGFAAPVALAAMTFAAYLSSVFPLLPQKTLAIGVIILLTVGHIHTRRRSAGLQGSFTLVKLLLIIAFCIGGILLTNNPQPVSFWPDANDWRALTSGAFAVSLIYVNYAYNGWNAATYLSAETENSQVSLPKILIGGTLLVMLAYVALNFVFLYTTPVALMKGKVEIGYVVAESLFGQNGARLTGIVMSLLLVSTVSAMTLAGPRVLQVMGQDYPLLSWLARHNHYGIPSRAILFQSALSILLVMTSGFQSVLIFSGFVLALNNFFAVLGVIWLRWKKPDLKRPFRIPGWPWPPLMFLLLTGWTITYLAMNQPLQLLWGVGLGVFGLFLWFIARADSDMKNL